ELLVHDIRAPAPALGQFDYVIAHGLYTWLDPSARAALLDAFKTHLAPDGIGYLSFNTHPGGHFRRAMRELAQWYAGDDATPGQEAERARHLFGRLSELRGSSDPYGALLANELPQLASTGLDHLAHDLLDNEWQPAWFSEFAADLARRELQYVGEAS